MAEEDMEDSRTKPQLNTDTTTDIQSSFNTPAFSPKSNSLDLYDDMLFNTPLPEMANNSSYIKKPSKPPPEEESVDLYSEFLDEKSKWNLASDLTSTSLDETGQENFCNKENEEKLSMAQCPSGDDYGAADTESKAEDNVNLDLFTEVLADELQQKHDLKSKLERKCAVAEARIRQLESELKEGQQKLQHVEAENVVIKTNMSSLLLAAKSEIKRKDNEIHRLNSLLTKRKINSFGSKNDDARKRNEMSPSRQRIVEIWNSAKKSGSKIWSNAGNTTPSKTNRDSDTVKRKRNEHLDLGTPKRQKLNGSRNATPDRKDRYGCDKSSESCHQNTQNHGCDKTETGRKKADGRHSSQRKSRDVNSDERLNTETNLDKNRESRPSKSKSDGDKRNSSDRKEKSSRDSGSSRNESKERSDKSSSGVLDLREILRRKREGKSGVAKQKSTETSSRKRHTGDPKELCTSDMLREEKISRTEKDCSSDGKNLKGTSVEEVEITDNPLSHTQNTDLACNTERTADCNKSEDLHTKIDNTDTEYEDKSSDRSKRHTDDPKDLWTSSMLGAEKISTEKACSSDMRKCKDVNLKGTSLEEVQITDNSLIQSQDTDLACNMERTTDSNKSEDLNTKIDNTDTEHEDKTLHTSVKDTKDCRGCPENMVSLPVAKKEHRRIRPVMLSEKKPSQGPDGQSCFDAVIKNIETRESYFFAAKVIHVDMNHESSTVVQSDNFNEETKSISAQTATLSEDPNTSKLSTHYTVENEHFLLCTKNLDQESSSTSLLSDTKVESVASDMSQQECSLDLIIKEESCSRTTPYKSSKSYTPKSGKYLDGDDKNIPLEKKSKSKKKKKHKTKRSENGVDHLEDIVETEGERRADISPDEGFSHVCTNEKAKSMGSNSFQSVSGVNEKEPSELPCPSETPCDDVSNRCDLNQNTVAESTEANSALPAEVEDSVDPLSSQCSLNVVSASTKKELLDGPASSSTVLDPRSSSHSSVKDCVTSNSIQASCVDARLNGHPRPPYRVEPFEFTSFPESYAKSEGDDEDRLVIAMLSESEKEDEQRDSSFEMDTSDANTTVICMTEKSTLSARCSSGGDECNNGKSDVEMEDTAKPTFSSVLQECCENGAENSSGFFPCDVLVEHNANSEACQDSSMKQHDETLSRDVNIGNISDKALEDKAHDEGDIVANKGMDNNSQDKKCIDRQMSLPACIDNLLESSSTTAVRTRSCSEPQSTSSHHMSSQSGSDKNHIFDLTRVKPCFSPVLTSICHPIDLSVKSEKNQCETSQSVINQRSPLGELSGFSISKDGALDLSRKTTNNFPETQGHTCNNDSIEQIPTSKQLEPTYEKVQIKKPLHSIKLKPTQPESELHCSNHDHVSTYELKISPSKDVVKLRVGHETEKSIQMANGSIEKNQELECLNESSEKDSLGSESCSEDESRTDISEKSANTSIQSLDTSNNSYERQSEENSGSTSPSKEMQEQNSSSSDSESENDDPRQPETCASKSVSSTQISSGTSGTSIVSSNMSDNQASSVTSITSTISHSGKISSSATAGSGSEKSLDSSSSSSDDNDSDNESSGDNRKCKASVEGDSDICVTDDNENDCESSQSQLLFKSLSSVSVQGRHFDIVKQDLELSDDSSINISISRESCENLLPSVSSLNVSNDDEKVFKLPDMSTSAFAKLASTSHSDVTKTQISSIIKTKSPEVPRKKLSFPVEENSVLSILADSCDGFDCEQGDHKDDCRKYVRDSPAEPEESQHSEDDDGCEEGELCDDTDPRKSKSKSFLVEEESQELTELLQAKKLLEKQIQVCKRSSKEPLSSTSADRDNRHRKHTHSSGSRTDRKSDRSSRDTREKDGHRGARSSGHDHDRFSREIHASDPRLSSRSSSRNPRDKEEPRHKHYSPSTHRSHMEDRRDRRRDSSPVSHRSSYKDQSKENHRREGSDRNDRYPTDSRHRNRSRDFELERSKPRIHHSRRNSRDHRS